MAPIILEPGVDPAQCRSSLLGWARDKGYICLRFTGDPELLKQWLEDCPGAHAGDPFPFYRDVPESLLVEQSHTDEALLMRFQPVARRNLRRAAEEGYEIRIDETSQALAGLWPLFEGLAQRKGFTYRPRLSFEALMDQSRPFGASRLYSAWIADRPVQAILVVRDRDCAHYVIGALDMASIGDRESPSVLLHWRAMRDFAAQQVRYYDLGTRSGEVHRFKLKFRPVERVYASPVTVVLRPAAFAVWRWVAVATLRRLWPRLKRVLGR